MEIKTTPLLFEGAPIIHLARAAAEGVLSPPVGMNAVARVLSISASATANGRTTESGLTCDGTVTLSVIYVDPDGALHGFDSSASFANESPLSDLPAGAPVVVDAVVSDVRHNVTGGSVNVHIELSLRYTVFPENNAAALTAIEGVGTTELLKQPAVLWHTVRTDDELTLTDEVRLPKEASDILSVTAFCRVSSVTLLGGSAAISGVLCADVLYTCMDQSPAQAVFSLPFDASADLPEGVEAAYARCRVLSIEGTLTGEDTLELNATAALDTIALRREEVELTADAYSSAEKLHCTATPLQIRRDVWADCRATARLELPLPTGMPEAEQVHYVRLRPASCTATPSSGSVALSATLHASVLYSCAAGNLHSFETTVFCDATCECPAAKENIPLSCTAGAEVLSTDGMPGRIAVRLNLSAALMGYELAEQAVLTDVQSEGSRGGSYGPVVYFPTDDETLWDIGRRFGTPQAELAEQNPGIEHGIPKAVLVNMRRFV